MSDPKNLTDRFAPADKRKWLNRLGILATVLLIGIGGLLGLTKYLTTDSGIRTWIFPQISKLLGMEIKAGRVEWHLLSSVKVDDLCLGPENKPLFKAKHLVANYDGREIFRGNYFIQRLSIDSAVLHLAEKSYTTTSSSTPLSPSNEVQTKETYTTPETAFKSIPNFTLSSLEIENLELSYSAKGYQTVLRNLQVKAKDIKPK